MSTEPARIATVSLEIQINAPADVVWRTLTDRIGDWWPEEFYAGGASGERQFQLDPKPGGLMLESWNGGGGTLWGTVVSAAPARSLQVLGYVFPNWGGPTEWYGSWDLNEADGSTTLRFSESAVGAVSDASMSEKDKGWKFLWNTLKAHVEGGEKPVWT